MNQGGPLRVRVRVGVGTPALHQALRAIPPEGWGDCIKVLGEIGARALREGWPSRPAGSDVAPAVAAPPTREPRGQTSPPTEGPPGEDNDLFQSLCSNLGIDPT